MENQNLRSVLQSAWNKRASLRASTNAFRLLNGAASGTPGLVVDMFSEYAVVYAYGEGLRERYGDFPEAVAEISGAQAVGLKDRVAKDESGREEGADLLGRMPDTAEVCEGPLKFVVHLRHPRNVGLFLDTRPLRETLPAARRGDAPRDVLNLFSYACSLGVAAARGNAGKVVNVDVSPRYLGWGRENYRANALPETPGAFVRMDCEEYLDWAARKGLAFDAVILDPPSFSRADGGTYSFAKDYWRLLEKCARVAKPGAALHALTNYGKISPARFRAQVEETLRACGRRITEVRALPLPEDFDPAPASAPWQPAAEGSLIALEAVLA